MVWLLLWFNPSFRHNVKKNIGKTFLKLVKQYFLKHLKLNKRNDKSFNNRAYSLFFSMATFLKNLWLIPNILKWQDCKIFTTLIPLQTYSRSSRRRCSVKKGALKNLWNFTVKHLCWSLFLIKLQTFRPATILRRDSSTDFFLWTLQSF